VAADAGEEHVVSDLHWLTAAEISAAYAKRRLSPVELVKALLARIAKFEPQMHAFIKLDADGALASARAAETEIRAGRQRGPLHGVPVGIKDIIDMAGERTTCHSKIFLKNVAREDAEVISRLRAAGAIFMGKLSLHEFAIGGPSFDLPFPPARNPWNVRHHPGGSSSGSGTALAAGFLPLALGTDTGGSIRNPAGTCGVVGLKPTYGLVSRRGVFPLAFTLDHIGPMTRSVRDVALALDVLAGHDAQDPGSTAVAQRGYGADLERGARGLKVGFVRHFHEQDMPAHPEVTAALDAAAKVMKREGATVVDVKLPRLQDLAGVQRVFMQAESWAVHAQWLRERPADYAELSRRKLMGGAFLSAGDYVHAQQRRLQLTDAVNDAFHDVDVLLCANSLDPACRIDDEEEVARTYPRQARAPFNLTGHPALAMMCGLSKAGLPIAVQMVGRMHDEVTLLRAAAAYERATDWHTRRPPM
jgi:aspartyl-tRNA(Asn)/glutamyl-tRNA(Gln) amidotransferase subunit A